MERIRSLNSLVVARTPVLQSYWPQWDSIEIYDGVIKRVLENYDISVKWKQLLILMSKRAVTVIAPNWYNRRKPRSEDAWKG